jgi:hypothetical protein
VENGAMKAYCQVCASFSRWLSHVMTIFEGYVNNSGEVFAQFAHGHVINPRSTLYFS